MVAATATAMVASGAEKPAVLGGKKLRAAAFPSWPVYDGKEEGALLETLRTGNWYRGSGQMVKKFEQAFAQLTGAKHALATANGTSALIVSMNALGVEAGDEVVIPPYTFIATVNVVLRQYALPVFVDTDAETFQMDARKLEAAMTERTRAVIPVHLGGNVADLDSILATAAKKNVPVIEDACQAHLAEWKGKKVGTLGATGCFSFQASKNLNSGEGGCMLTGSEETFHRGYAFHNNGSGLKAIGANFTYASTGQNLRLCEFQAALLMAQMTRLEEQSRRRSENAKYLTSQLEKIPGVVPARQYAGCTNNAYHLYMFRFKKEQFAGMTRERFLKALAAEGIPAAGGYSPLNKQQFLANAIASRGFARLFPARTLKEWMEKNQCPVNDKLCEEAVWFTQNMLIGPREDMDVLAEAVRRIQAHAAEVAKA